MLLNLLDSYFLSGLTLLVLVSIGLLHFLLFWEYAKQDRLHTKRLQDLENLVKTELLRSKSMNHQNWALNQMKEKTEENLSLIKLQVEAMKATENKNLNS